MCNYKGVGDYKGMGNYKEFKLNKLSLFRLNLIYCMAVSHKDWKLPNSGIWLAEIDFDRGLDFPI